MTARDWPADRRRQLTAKARAQDLYDEATSASQALRAHEQAKYLEIAKNYPTINFCALILAQVMAGKRVTPRQAAVLLKIDHEQRTQPCGWGHRARRSPRQIG